MISLVKMCVCRKKGGWCRYPSDRYEEYLEICVYHQDDNLNCDCIISWLIDPRNQYFDNIIYRQEKEFDPTLESFLIHAKEWNSPRLSKERLKELALERLTKNLKK